MAATFTYFAGRGLGERIRYMLWECQIEYKERTLTKELLAELRAKGDLLFQQVPLLEIDGLKLVQSSSILRYLARKHNMYGKNDTEAVECDMMADGLIDAILYFVRYVFAKDKESHITNEIIPKLPRYLKPMQDRIQKGDFLLGDHISYPDLLLFELLESISDIIPKTLDEYPSLKLWYGKMCKRSSIKRFHESGSHYPFPGDDYVAHVNQVLDR